MKNVSINFAQKLIRYCNKQFLNILWMKIHYLELFARIILYLVDFSRRRKALQVYYWNLSHVEQSEYSVNTSSVGFMSSDQLSVNNWECWACESEIRSSQFLFMAFYSKCEKCLFQSEEWRSIDSRLSKYFLNLCKYWFSSWISLWSIRLFRNGTTSLIKLITVLNCEYL